MTLPTFPIDESYLIGGWLESFFWGLFTLFFAMTLYSIYKKRRNGWNKFTTFSIIALYILATAHISLALVRLIQGFIFYRDTIGPILYFANISVRLNMAKDYLYITNLVLGDLVVVWRLWVVWGKNYWVAIFPVIMIIGELIAGYGSISQWFLPHPVPVTMVHWGTAMFVMSMATNIVVTAAIASRIWWVTKRMRDITGIQTNDRYTRVILLIVESGAIIAAAKITEFTLFRLAPVDGINGLNALYIVYEIMPQITGLAPTVIVYAVNNGYTQAEDNYTTRSTLAFGSRSFIGRHSHHPTSATTQSEDMSLSTITFAASRDDFAGAGKRPRKPSPIGESGAHALDLSAKRMSGEARGPENLGGRHSPESIDRLDAVHVV